MNPGELPKYVVPSSKTVVVVVHVQRRFIQLWLMVTDPTVLFNASDAPVMGR
jgi:hypothetical protein